MCSARRTQQTAKKCAAAVRNGLTPILCVGELLADREAGATTDVVLRQLRAGLAELRAERRRVDGDRLRAGVGDRHGRDGHARGRVRCPRRDSALPCASSSQAPKRIPVLYGGSVNAGNAKSLLAAEGVDGLLVGGASLDVEGWASICDT